MLLLQLKVQTTLIFVIAGKNLAIREIYGSGILFLLNSVYGKREKGSFMNAIKADT